MKKFPFYWLVLLAFMLSACVNGGQVLQTPPPATQTPEPTKPAPTEAPTGEVGIFDPAVLEGLDPKDILIQLTYEPTFSMPEVVHIFGRIPTLTLYADGTLVYLEEGEMFTDQEVFTVKLSPQESAALVQQVLDLGFGQLESWEEMCGPEVNGVQNCVADAAVDIYRVRMPDGTLRELRIYAELGKNPEIQQAVKQFLMAYTHPEAEAYQPAKAALFVTYSPDAEAGEAWEWPLEESILTSLEGDYELTAVVVEGEELAAIIEKLGKNTGELTFEHMERTYRLYLVPWLPYDDFTSEVQEAFPAIEG